MSLASARHCFSLSCHHLAFLHVYAILAQCTAISSDQPSAAGAYSNSTTLQTTPPSRPSNASNNPINADACWSSWDAYSASSLNCSLTTTATSELTFTDQKSSVVYETYKLCDGHPRANATAGESTSRTTASESGSAYTTYTEVLPPSGIPESTATTLITSRATYYETACATAVAEPKCEIGVEDCQSLMRVWSAGEFKRGKPPCTVPVSADPCDDCWIYIPTVKLIYFAVSMTGDFCGEYATATPTYAANLTTPSTIILSGQTFTSGSAYLSYAGITALAGGDSARQCGTPLPAGILGLPSSRLSTYRGHAAAMPIASLAPRPLNFADLAPNPVPWDAWISQETCATHREYATCQTITQAAYRPWIVYPTEFWEMETMWAKCGSDVFGIMDPPSALPKADEVPMPTMPSVTGDGVGVTTSASPAVTAPKPTAEQTLTSLAQQSSASSGAGDSSSHETSTQEPVATISQTSANPSTVVHPGAGGTNSEDLEVPTADFPLSDSAGTAKPTTITADFTFEPTMPSDDAPTTVFQSSGSPALTVSISTDDWEQFSTVESSATLDEGGHEAGPTGAVETPQTSSSDTQGVVQPSLTAPALSILASALSPFASTVGSSVGSAISSILSQANSILQPGVQQTHVPSSSMHAEDPSSSTAVVASLGDGVHTLSQTSDRIIFGSVTLSAGDQTTISGVPIAAYSSALLVGSTFIPLPENTQTSSAASSRPSSDLLPPIVESSSPISTDLPRVITASPTSPGPTGEQGGSPAVSTVAGSNGSVRLGFGHVFAGFGTSLAVMMTVLV